MKITATDTGKVPNTSATAASSGSDLNGMAVKAACDTIRDRMAAFLAERHQADAGHGALRGRARCMSARESYSFAEAAKLAYEGRRQPVGDRVLQDARRSTGTGSRGQGRPFFYFAYGAAVTEVVIDTLTGENRILRTDILHDAGASLNPAIDIGQIEGGFVQGAGWLTTEELVWDDDGRLRTHAPSTYKIPACSDRPAVFNVALWDGPNREETIYRSKAVGEPPFMLGISALHGAVGCGGGLRRRAIPALDAPATPERVLAAVRAGARCVSFDLAALRDAVARAWPRSPGSWWRRSHGSAPREVGAAMLVWDGRAVGHHRRRRAGIRARRRARRWRAARARRAHAARARRWASAAAAR